MCFTALADVELQLGQDDDAAVDSGSSLRRLRDASAAQDTPPPIKLATQGLGTRMLKVDTVTANSTSGGANGRASSPPDSLEVAATNGNGNGNGNSNGHSNGHSGADSSLTTTISSSNGSTSGTSTGTTVGGNGNGNGGSGSTGPSTQPSAQPSALPSSQPQQQAACSRDGVQAADASGSCGQRLVTVQFSQSVSQSPGSASTAVMCADPAAFAPESGTLRMSLCWRDADLPASMLLSSGNRLRVTLPRLQRFGVASMSAGAYSVRLEGAESMGATVHPAAAGSDASVGPLAVGTTSSALTVPTGGASALTLWFELPATAELASSASASTDSVSNSTVSNGTGNGNGNSKGRSGASALPPARYVSFVLTGPPNPPAPASACKCAPAAASYANAACPAGTAPLTATVIAISATSALTSGESFVRCVPAPAYDPISRRLSFSTCWRYACLPDSFSRQPYQLVVGPMAGAASVSGALPAGHYRVRGSMPRGVEMAVEWAPVGTAAGKVWLSTAAGQDEEEVEVDAAPLAVRIRVPFDVDVDGAAGSLELKFLHLNAKSTGSSEDNSSTADSNGNSGNKDDESTGSSNNPNVVIFEAADGGPPVSAPALPAAAAAAATTATTTLTAVSDVWIPRRVVRSRNASGSSGSSTLAELEELIRLGMMAGANSTAGQEAANTTSMSINVTGYRLAIPIGLRDFSTVADCGADSLAALHSAAATALSSSSFTSGGSAPVLMCVTCSYSTVDVANSQRRALQQTCAPRISVPVTLDAPASASADLDSLLAASIAALSAAYGDSSTVCPLDASSPDIEVTSKLSVTLTMPAARVVGATAAAADGGGAAAALAACITGPQMIATSLGLGTGEARLVGCELTAVATAADPSPASTAPGNGTGTDGASQQPSTGAAADTPTAAGGGGGVSAVLIGAAVAGGVAAAVAAVVAAVLVSRRRQHAKRDQGGGGAAAALSGRSRKYDSRGPSLDGGGGATEVFEPDSDDSAGLALRDAAMGAKHTRRSSYGGGGGGHGGATKTQSSKSVAFSRPRAISSNGGNGPSSSKRPSLFGGDGAAPGLEAGFLSIVPQMSGGMLASDDAGPNSAPPAVYDTHSHWTHDSSTLQSSSSLFPGPHSKSALQARGLQSGSNAVHGINGHDAAAAAAVNGHTSRSIGNVVRWGRVSHPGCTPQLLGSRQGSEAGHDGDDGEAGGGSGKGAYGRQHGGGDYDWEGGRPSRTSRPSRPSRNSHGSRGGPTHFSDGGAGSGGRFDYFGLDEAVKEDLAGVMRSLPASGVADRLAARRTSNSGGTDTGGVVCGGGGDVTGAAARRRSRSGTQPPQHHVGLRRSNAGALLFAPSPVPLPAGGEDTDSSEGDSCPSPPASPQLGRTSAASGGAVARFGSAAKAFHGGSVMPTPRQTAPSVPSDSASTTTRRAKVLCPPPARAFMLPGADSDGGTDVMSSSAAAAAAATAGEEADRDLLRVQSRRPGFVDSSGGCLAAAVASSLSAAAMPRLGAAAAEAYDIGFEDLDGGGGNGGGNRSRAAPRRSSWVEPSARAVEPRRGGFIRGRRNSVAPYRGLGSPTLPCMPNSMHGPTGSATAALGGGAAWSAPLTALNSPGADLSATLMDMSAWAGVVGGRRSGGGSPCAADGSADGGGCCGDDGRWEAHRHRAAPRGAAGLAVSRGPSRRDRYNDNGDKEEEEEEQKEEEEGTVVEGGVENDNGDDVGTYAVRRAPCILRSGALEPEVDVDGPPAARRKLPPLVYPAVVAVAADVGSNAMEPLASAAVAAAAALEGDESGSDKCVPAAQPHPYGGHHYYLRRSNASSTLASAPPTPLPEAGDGDDRNGDEAEDEGPGETRSLPSPSPAPPPLTLADLPDVANPYEDDGGNAASPDGVAINDDVTERPYLDSRGAADVEVLSPAYPPSATVRAREPPPSFLHSASYASSAASIGGGGGGGGMMGLVDREVEANAAGGAARLVAMRQLAVGPSRPAWGLVNAGVGPFKRSIASVQYAHSIAHRGPAAAAVAAALAAATVTEAAAPASPTGQGACAAPGTVYRGGGGGAAFSPRGGGPRAGLPPRRLLSRNSTSGMSVQSSEASGPFIRMLADTPYSPRGGAPRNGSGLAP